MSEINENMSKKGASADCVMDMIVLAGGLSTRFSEGKTTPPKQFHLINGKMLITHCLDRILSWPSVGKVILVLPKTFTEPDNDDGILRHLSAYSPSVTIVSGGKSRLESAFNGLKALAKQKGHAGFVAIHDAARPFVTHTVLDRLLQALMTGKKAVLPVLPVTDTIRQITDDGMSNILDRSSLRRIQTPQAFDFSEILKAHEKTRKAIDSGQFTRDTSYFTDDGMVASENGLDLCYVEGDSAHEKITFYRDLRQLEQHMTRFDIRTASGFDVHKFSRTKPGPIMVCGVPVDHSHGLEAHSDGDVGLHALCDALLGTVGIGDIGTFFPPSDPKWKDAASDQFLAFAVEKIHQAGGRINHLDVTIIAERPKIGPFREQMVNRLSQITGLDKRRISVKATTTEMMGFTGRGEGIAALSQATICLPETDES